MVNQSFNVAASNCLYQTEKFYAALSHLIPNFCRYIYPHESEKDASNVVGVCTSVLYKQF